MPKPYPPEFRRRAVELARQGDKPLLQLAKDLGVSRSCLQNWMRQADVDEKPDGKRLLTAGLELVRGGPLREFSPSRPTGSCLA